MCRQGTDRDEFEVVYMTETDRWDALLKIAQAWGAIDHRPAIDTSEEEGEESFLTDDSGNDRTCVKLLPHDLSPCRPLERLLTFFRALGTVHLKVHAMIKPVKMMLRALNLMVKSKTSVAEHQHRRRRHCPASHTPLRR